MITLTCTLQSWQTALIIILPIIAVAVVIFVACGVTRKPKNNAGADNKRERRGRPVKAPDKSERAASTSAVISERSEPSLTVAPAAAGSVESTATALTASQTLTTVDMPTETAEQTENAKQPKFTVRYNKSFTARLILASDEIKQFYAELANKLLGFEKIKHRISWACASFNCGRDKIAKINVKGKSLYLFVALDPNEFAETKYRVKDVSDKKRYESVPAMFKIKSNRALKQASEIVEILVGKKGLSPADNRSPIRASDYPVDTLEHLLARKLVKENKVRNKAATQPSPIAKVLKTVTVTQAQKLVTDEAAATLVTVKNGATVAGKKYPVNIDALSANFGNGETADITTLKQRRLVPQSATAIKILARGTLDKKLTVYADDFSADAVKMIALTGGKAIKGRK